MVTVKAVRDALYEALSPDYEIGSAGYLNAADAVVKLLSVEKKPSWEVNVCFKDGTEITVNSETEPNVQYGGDEPAWVTIGGVPSLPYVKRDEVLYVTVDKSED